MKKLASKVAHNGPKTLFSVLPTSPNTIFCSIKMAPCATSTYIMTLPDGYWLLNIRYLTWIWDSDMFVCFFRASTNFEGHPNWVFRLLTFSSLALSLKEITFKGSEIHTYDEPEPSWRIFGSWPFSLQLGIEKWLKNELKF